jgi:hypothetical protein
MQSGKQDTLSTPCRDARRRNKEGTQTRARIWGTQELWYYKGFARPGVQGKILQKMGRQAVILKRGNRHHGPWIALHQQVEQAPGGTTPASGSLLSKNLRGHQA